MRPVKWTETAIQQAFDDFLKQHGRLPTKREMYEKYNGKFPRPLSVKLTLGITLKEYLEKNYTEHFRKKQASMYGIKPQEYWIEDFKNQYIKHGCPSEVLYNKLRSPKTPNTKTLAKIIGVSKWSEVLVYCGFQKNKPAKLTGEIDFAETPENFQSLNDLLERVRKSL